MFTYAAILSQKSVLLWTLIPLEKNHSGWRIRFSTTNTLHIESSLKESMVGRGQV